MKKIANKTSSAKSALDKRLKNVDSRGLNTKYNYSSFWMEDKWDTASKFSGTSHQLSSSSNILTLIKLTNYRRAITNFVKIITKQDIPVVWYGSDSFTDGKSICLTTDIKDSNFDVTVGLALHEASHITLTDFDILNRMRNGQCESLNILQAQYADHLSIPFIFTVVRDLLNWVEDRRIDHYVFSTSPGYKAYYHKLYDHYWNSDSISKGLLSKNYRDSTVYTNYMFHIINMMNPAFNPAALPRLDEIVKLVDIHNIGRIKSTEESLVIALEIADIVLDQHIKLIKDEEESKESRSNNEEGGSDIMDESDSNDKESGGENSDGNDSTGENVDEDVEDLVEEMLSLNDSELGEIAKAFAKQKTFLDGKTYKKSATKNLQRQLNNVASQSIDVQTVGDSNVGVRTALLYDYTNSAKILEACKIMQEATGIDKSVTHSKTNEYRETFDTLVDKDFFSIKGVREYYSTAISDGLNMGALLGKKLQLHNESRERVDTRLRSGKIDAKRLAHAGYGVEGIFKQINIDKYKKANIHISLDGSGSMNGAKWQSTIRMTVAIAKAVTYTQNINIQVSIRATKNTGQGDTPCNIVIYNSAKNKINHLIAAFNLFNPMSMTPEGLCFEAMLLKDMLIPSSSEVDSYFLNISDGEPGCTKYNGWSAVNHTKKQVDKMKSDKNISILSFYLSENKVSANDTVDEMLTNYNRLLTNFMGSTSGKCFRHMYGKDATVVESSNTMQIAKALNKRFLTKDVG